MNIRRSEMFPPDASRVLAFAATPTFALMALVTGLPGDGQPELLWSAAHAMAPFGGMIPMYLLMSVFHSSPWLKLIRACSIGLATTIRAPVGNQERR
jgi:hypothetical protein